MTSPPHQTSPNPPDCFRSRITKSMNDSDEHLLNLLQDDLSSRRMESLNWNDAGGHFSACHILKQFPCQARRLSCQSEACSGLLERGLGGSECANERICVSSRARLTTFKVSRTESHYFALRSQSGCLT